MYINTYTFDGAGRVAAVGGIEVTENLSYEMLHEEFLDSDYEGTFSNYLADRLVSLSEVIRVLDGRISQLERDLVRLTAELEHERQRRHTIQQMVTLPYDFSRWQTDARIYETTTTDRTTVTENWKTKLRKWYEGS